MSPYFTWGLLYIAVFVTIVGFVKIVNSKNRRGITRWFMFIFGGIAVFIIAIFLIGISPVHAASNNFPIGQKPDLHPTAMFVTFGILVVGLWWSYSKKIWEQILGFIFAFGSAVYLVCLGVYIAIQIAH